MATISKLFAEIGFRVNTQGLKEFQTQLKALSANLKAQIQDSKAQAAASKAVEAARKAETAEIRKGIASQNLKKAATQAETAEIRKLDLQQRMETRAQKEAERQRQRSTSSLRSFMIGVTAVTYGLAKLTQQTRQHALAYRDFMFQTGMPLKNLQQFEAAAAQVAPNLTGERIASELTTLQQNLTNIEFGQGNIFPYQLLGISATTKDATKIVDGLRNAISGLSNTRAINLIERMGLSRDWLYILRMTREEIAKIEAVMLSEKQVNSVISMSLAFNKLKFALSNLRNQFVAFFSEAITVFIENFSKATNAISLFLKESSYAGPVLGALGAALLGLTVSVAPITSALLALYLVLEDMYVATHGGEALFDWNASAWDDTIEALKVIRDILVEIWEITKALFNMPNNMEQSFTNLLNGKKPSEGQEGWDKWLNPVNLVEKLVSPALNAAEWGTRLGNTINNNINMNGYTPNEGGEFIGSLNQNQLDDKNMIASQLNTVGSA